MEDGLRFRDGSGGHAKLYTAADAWGGRAKMPGSGGHRGSLRSTQVGGPGARALGGTRRGRARVRALWPRRAARQGWPFAAPLRVIRVLAVSRAERFATPFLHGMRGPAAMLSP